MSWTIRPAHSDDIPAIVDLINAVQRPEERTTLDVFRHEEGMRRPETAFTRLVATDDHGMIAVGQIQNTHTRPRHKFFIYIAVHPSSRRGGLGTELEGRLREFAFAHGGTELTAMIRDDDIGTRAFLEKIEYREAYQRFEMELDVTKFDWRNFPGWQDKLGDLRLMSLAEAGPTEGNVQKLFELSMVLSRDVPHPEGAPEYTMEDFQQFAQMPGFSPEGLFIIADGDRWVGVSVVHFREGPSAYTDFTGVDRDYRGRGLATSLKLATIDYVQRKEVPVMRTTNDTVNNAMVAVNEKLGYRRLPARVAMKLMRNNDD